MRVARDVEPACARDGGMAGLSQDKPSNQGVALRSWRVGLRYSPSMGLLVRSLLIWLLVLTVPAQGMAAVTMAFCGPGHAGAASVQSQGKAHAADHAHHHQPSQAATDNTVHHGPGAHTEPRSRHNHAAHLAGVAAAGGHGHAQTSVAGDDGALRKASQEAAHRTESSGELQKGHPPVLTW